MRIVIHYLESIEGVAIFPIIGIIIFFSFFVVLLWWVFKLDKRFIKNMSDAPLLDDDNEDEIANSTTLKKYGNKS
jgi:cbb3-type cytochrome oxidase subunit 3